MNLEKIKEKIKEKGLKRAYIADELGISTYTLQMKLNGKLDFWSKEINRLSVILSLTTKEKSDFFYKSS